MTTQRKIFISYRRSDEPLFADLVRNKFIERYGRDNVFMDFDTIPTGVKFADFIRGSVQESDAMIVIIGPKWLELLRQKFATFEEDYIRVEIGLALQLGKPVVPICIMGASMPHNIDLPPDLLPLWKYNAAFLDHTDFHDKINRIVDNVEKSLSGSNLRQAQEFYERGDRKWRAGAFDDAVAACTIAIQLDPNFAEAYRRRGTALDSKGDYNGAIADYNEALRLDPQLLNTYISRGVSRYAQGDYEGAIDDYTEAIRLNPQYALAYNNRGNTYRKKDLDGAIADYTEAIRLDPHEAAAYLNRGLTYRDKGDLSGALADYQKYLDLGGGKAYRNQAQVEQWIHDLQQEL